MTREFAEVMTKLAIANSESSIFRRLLHCLQAYSISHCTERDTILTSWRVRQPYQIVSSECRGTRPLEWCPSIPRGRYRWNPYGHCVTLAPLGRVTFESPPRPDAFGPDRSALEGSNTDPASSSGFRRRRFRPRLIVAPQKTKNWFGAHFVPSTAIRRRHWRWRVLRCEATRRNP